MITKCVRVIIAGRVQAVGYRAWIEQKASALDLRGWARNRTDGSVEAVLAGPADDVDTMLELAHKGPRLSAVANIETSQATDEGWPDFSIRPTNNN